MKVQFGTRELELGGPYLATELRDSTDIIHDRAALDQRFAQDGYLLLRGLIDREAVIRARRTIVEYMAEGGCFKKGSDPMDAIVAPPGANGPNTMGRKGITHAPEVRTVLENKALFDFFQVHFGKPALTYDYKWLRAVKAPEFTGAHYDVVYMGRGTTANLRTCWIPFSDISIEHGPLALCVGSHNLPGFQKLRDTYGKMDVDRDRVGGWFSDDPVEIVDKFGGKWQTSNFRMGDVLIFGMYTLHSSLCNASDRYRISCDVRYQPATDPVDERWVGENPIAHYAWHSEPEKIVPMEKARADWGV